MKEVMPQETKQQRLPESQELTALNIPHLKRFWHKHQLNKQGRIDQELIQQEWELDLILINELNLGLEPALACLYQCSKLTEFEDFVLTKNNDQAPDQAVKAINQALRHSPAQYDPQEITNVLSEEQMAFWNEQGYIIIPSVLNQQECDTLLEEINRFLNFSLQVPDTWYLPHESKQQIMVQFFDSPIQKKIRKKEVIRKAFAQLWQTNQLTVSTDRVSINPPETELWKFPGPDIHWDLDHFNPPIPFRTQGLIYLTDTAENQGAFSCAPGFHHKIDNWLRSLPDNTNPQEQDWSKFNIKPIAAKAGDLIIWHHALPHGSSPNRAHSPRVVQYINMYPLHKE
ncbi:phytanoyl-CoA dioxygenase family protein [Oceanospirillum beijerinckii]|uniref:phytanoyl-CoA dioxygenase family protein n=1 Tax=Oceanospirillum beijerinckii TaxID=64976 RepID=UPI0004254338|nr:phytanoyl-CoA dioxygenase family protein [Oceanospirillum beijerinckii]